MQHEQNWTEKNLYNGLELKFVSFISPEPPKGPFLSSRQKADSVRAEMVDYAREKWPMFFSRFFEVVKLSGRDPSAYTVSCLSVMYLNIL